MAQHWLSLHSRVPSGLMTQQHRGNLLAFGKRQMFSSHSSAPRVFTLSDLNQQHHKCSKSPSATRHLFVTEVFVCCFFFCCRLSVFVHNYELAASHLTIGEGRIAQRLMWKPKPNSSFLWWHVWLLCFSLSHVRGTHVPAWTAWTLFSPQ